MHPREKSLNIAWFLIFSLAFSAQVIPGIFQNSPTDDEPIELTNGYFYWKGDAVNHNFHPPLSKTLQALPLRLKKLDSLIPASMAENQLRAYQFFFISNKGLFEWMTACGRLISLLFGLGIGLLLFMQTRQAHPVSALTCLCLWAFHPTLLAYSGLAMADITVSFFFLASVLAFKRHLEKPGLFWSLVVGSLAALAACSKFSALALVPLFAFLEVLHFWMRKGSKTFFQWRSVAVDWLYGAVAFFLIISLIYLPGTLLESGHRFPAIYFFNGLKHMMSYSDYHHPNFFLGQCSRQNHWLYFPVVFLLKNSIPFTLFTLLAVWEGLRKRVSYPTWMWMTPLFFFFCILPVQNLGVRYLLPAFPFLILMASKMAGECWNKRAFGGKQTWKLLIAGLLLWNSASVLASQPNLISYFNDLIPAEKKFSLLSDCDLDMGQDLKRLSLIGRQRGWKQVKLAQFGGALDPSFYGLNWVPWTQKDITGPQPGQVYAVNVTLFQTGPVFWPELLPIARGWSSTTPPTGRVGDSWIYFETPGKPSSDSSPSLSSVRIF